MLCCFRRCAGPHRSSSKTVDRLEADHRVVSALLDRVEELADGLDDQPTRQALVVALTRLSTDLLEHLAFEEESIGPVLNSWEHWPSAPGSDVRMCRHGSGPGRCRLWLPVHCRPRRSRRATSSTESMSVRCDRRALIHVEGALSAMSTEAIPTETIEFQAEARQLLQLMIHSIYSTKDVFLRELISNSSDALDKLRLAAYQDKDLEVDTSDLHIAIDIDPDARTLTVARQRHRDDPRRGRRPDRHHRQVRHRRRCWPSCEQAREAGGASEEATAELIGQFGVGFYSSFMVADQVTLVTRKAGAHTGRALGVHRRGHLHGRRGPDAPQGTAVTLHLKPEDAEDALHDYTKPADASAASSSATPTSSPGRSGWRRTRPPAAPTRTTTDTSTPSRSRRSSTPARRCGRGRRARCPRRSTPSSTSTSATTGTEPLETIRLSAEGTFEYQALLFLPSHAPMDLFMRDSKRGVQLYVKRVFIMDDCEALVPEYLRFVKGVVDANDLSLNISREILQQDRQIQLIRKRLVKKVLSTVKTMQDERAGEVRDVLVRARPGRQGGPALRLRQPGGDPGDLLVRRPPTTPEKPTTLRDYLARMPEGQDSIYYVTGESRAALENSPHMEAFRAKGYEVLLLTDPVDEVWVDAVPSFEGKPLASIAKGEVDLGGDDVDDDTKTGLRRPARPGWRRPWPTTSRRSGSRTGSTTSAAVPGRRPRRPDPDPGEDVPGDGPGAAEGQADPGAEPAPTRWSPGSGRARGAAGRPGLADTAQLLYGMALLAEGGELADPRSSWRCCPGGWRAACPETKLNGEVACEIDPWIAGEFGRVVEGGRIRSRRGSGGWCDGDLVSHGLQVVDQSAFACFGVVAAGEVVRTQVAVGGTVVQDMPDDHDEGMGDRDGGLSAALLAEPAVQAAELGADVGAGAPADQAHSVRIERTSALPLRVRPDLCFPADSLFPGHNPAHDARCAAVGNRDMSTPISEMITCAARSPIPGMRQQQPQLLGERVDRPPRSGDPGPAIMLARWSM